MTNEPDIDDRTSPDSQWDDLQMMWQAEAQRTKVQLSLDELAEATGRRAEELRRIVRWRDYREIVISMVMIPVWIWIGVAQNQPWTWYLTLIAIVWGAGYQYFTRQHQLRLAAQVPADASYLQTLKEHRRQVQHQIDHLGSVLWWYLLPYGVTISIYFIHVGLKIHDTAGALILHVGFLITVVVVFYYYLYRLNHSTANNKLKPQRDALDQVIAGLESDNQTVDQTASQQIADFNAGSVDLYGSWNALAPAWWMACLITTAVIVGFIAGYATPPQLDLPRWVNGSFGSIIGYCFSIIALQIYRYWRSPNSTANHQAISGQLRGPAIVLLIWTVVIGLMGIALVYQFDLSNRAAGEDRSVRNDDAGVFALAPDEIANGDYQLVDRWLGGLVPDRFPSLSVAIVRDGRIDHLKSFGCADAATKTEATPQTPYHVASVTKAFTGMLAAILHERGVIDLDNSVLQYLPDGASIGLPGLDSETITLRHLATHTSGLPRGVPGKVQSAENFYELEPELLYNHLRRVTLSNPPGSKERYSNLGFGLLGHALERATDQSLDELIQEHLAVPLRLKATFIPYDQAAYAQHPTVATGYARTVLIRYSKTHSLTCRLAGSGGLVSSAEDLATFLIANMDEDQLSDETLQLTRRPMKLNDGSLGGTGLGWSIRHRPGIGEVIKKNGGRSNCGAWIGFSPKHRIGVVVLTNTGERSVDEIGYQLLDLALPIEDRLLFDRGVYAQVSPFDRVRWDETDSPTVRVNGRWIRLTSVDGTPIDTIIRFAKQRYGGDYRKRFSEDFVQVMFEMDQPIGWKVTLGYQGDSSTDDALIATMSVEARQAVREANR